jgi:hypothetical protein
MKIKHLIALTALALGLAAGGIAAPSIAGGRGGMTGEFNTLAAGAAGGVSGEWRAGGAGGDLLAGSKPSIISG